MGECGFRGGYAEILGMDKETRMVLTKILSSMLCPNIVGQLMLSTYVNPPIEGDPSYCLFKQEKNLLLLALKKKAQTVHQLFNSLNGLKLNPLIGSMYAFPRVYLPQKFVDSVVNSSSISLRNPDEHYCMLLLEKTGMVSVPGSGFGQKKDTWHFRITILPSEDQLNNCLELYKSFHLNFMNEYT